LTERERRAYSKAYHRERRGDADASFEQLVEDMKAWKEEQRGRH